jgi:hypothetical protein
MVSRPAPPDTLHMWMWKRNDSRQADLEDAINRSREEIRRPVPGGPERPARTELDAPRSPEPTPHTELGSPEGPEPPSPTEVQAPGADRGAIREHDVAAKPTVAESGLHPFLQGLLEIVPEPGLPWPLAKREQWLEAARNVFALIYDDSSEQHPHLRVLDARTTSAAPETNPAPDVGRHSA